jgi:hypothetical protein
LKHLLIRVIRSGVIRGGNGLGRGDQIGDLSCRDVGALQR